MPFVKSKPPLPTRSLRFLRAAAGYTSSALWLHHAHPFVAAAEKNAISFREAEGLPTELSHTRFVTDNAVIVSKNVQDLDSRFLIMLSGVTCDCRKPINNCGD